MYGKAYLTYTRAVILTPSAPPEQAATALRTTPAKEPGGAPASLPRCETVPFVADLASHGERAALITRDGELTYQELADRVADVARRLGTTRRLVLMAASNSVESVVGYLGALAGGHPVLLTQGDRAPDAMVDAYDPDVVVSTVGGELLLDVRRAISAHDLHPELALLLSTSGSTGSPKLVRLSHRNLQANAESIAGCLGIRATDRAATTLPMHYCYGLSVIHSHLLRGAALILTDLSVVDACFWELFRDAGGTSFAGVPHTFELLDRLGFSRMRLPKLRYVTQAGGRMQPDQVRHYAELGRREGWDLVVMYGQTEATARMAYLPPDLAASHPHTIGVPIPGARFTLEPVPEVDKTDAAELVYHGDNVMLGYAETPADLARGRTVHALRTGDLARRTPDGLYEIIGRRSRFAKVVGLRVDLQRVETMLATQGVNACCADVSDGLVVAADGRPDADEIARIVAAEYGLPPSAIRAVAVDELPRLATGKPDYQAVRELAASPTPATGERPAEAQPGSGTDGLRALYAELLGRPDATEEDSFVSLGGDSLSYVEMSVRLEQALGQLPPSWHTTPIRDLVPARRRRRFALGSLETSVALRAVAIIVIVSTHVGMLGIRGGAHVLLAVAGFNFARFQLTSAERRERLRHQVVSIARIVVPSVVWIAAMLAVTDTYSLANVFLLNGVLGPESWTSTWRFWFVEVLVYILLLLAALMAIPWVDRLERRFPFGFVLGLLALGLLTRYGIVEFGLPHTAPAFWLFATGWAIARASRWQHRALLTAVIVATVPGFWDNPGREAIMIAGISLLVWAPNIVCPRGLSRVLSVLATSSLYIYLTHWQVYPLLASTNQLLALVASVAVGIAYWLLATRVMAWVVDRSTRTKPEP